MSIAYCGSCVSKRSREKGPIGSGVKMLNCFVFYLIILLFVHISVNI